MGEPKDVIYIANLLSYWLVEWYYGQFVYLAAHEWPCKLLL